MYCETCKVKDESICLECSHYPIYDKLLKLIPTTSKYMRYIPVCHLGYTDCIHDPAYIQCYHPNFFKVLYNDLSLEEVAKNSCVGCSSDCCYYDDEDK